MLDALVEGVVALAALWSEALVFGFTGCEYEGAALELALLDGWAVVEVAAEFVPDCAFILSVEVLDVGAGVVLAAPAVAAAD